MCETASQDRRIVLQNADGLCNAVGPRSSQILLYEAVLQGHIPQAKRNLGIPLRAKTVSCRSNGVNRLR